MCGPRWAEMGGRDATTTRASTDGAVRLSEGRRKILRHQSADRRKGGLAIGARSAKHKGSRSADKVSLRYGLPPNSAAASSGRAADFLDWLVEHGLSRREWTVDEIWFLANEDFAPALGFALPPRRVFLGALQRCAGVVVQYDKRIYDRLGIYRRKTTFYRFSLAPPATRF